MCALCVYVSFDVSVVCDWSTAGRRKRWLKRVPDLQWAARGGSRTTAKERLLSAHADWLISLVDWIFSRQLSNKCCLLIDGFVLMHVVLVVERLGQARPGVT
ncbi:Short transient receptor potential channel [Trichinella pseudospiralis]